MTLARPIIYLGIPLGGNPKRKLFQDGVVKQVSWRLENWKWVFFSLGDRVTLIHACLSSIPVYWIFLFKVPVSLIECLEGIMRNSLWAGNGEERRDHLVKWEVRASIELLDVWALRIYLGTCHYRNLSFLWHKVNKNVHGSQWNGLDVVAMRSTQ